MTHPNMYAKFVQIYAIFPSVSVLVTINNNIRYEWRIIIVSNLTTFKLNISVLFIINGIHSPAEFRYGVLVIFKILLVRWDPLILATSGN